MNLEEYHEQLERIYNELNKIHDNLRKELSPKDFINIGSFTLESKGALFSAIGELHKVINVND